MSLTSKPSDVQDAVPETQLWADAQYEWCIGFARSLVYKGLTHVVMSPGSRSTPMVLAFEKTPEIQFSVVLDERSASFMALGLSKTGSPAAFLCTSGTATTHAYAAMWEAKESRVPLIAITADRPPRLRDKGASQTIHQVGMFGSAAVAAYDIGQPLGLKAGAQTGTEAFEMSMMHQGPVHVNIGFDKPFEPSSWDSQAHDFVETSERSSERSAEPSIPVNLLGQDAPSQGFQADEVTSFTSYAGERPVVLLGPMQGFHADQPLSQALSLLARHLPTLSETGSREVFSVLYGCSAKPPDWTPSSILWFDRAPYSPALLAWMQQCQAQGVRMIQCSWDGEIREPFDLDAASIKGLSFATFTSWVMGGDGGKKYDQEDGQKKVMHPSCQSWLESIDTDWRHQWEAVDQQLTSTVEQQLKAHTLEGDTHDSLMDSEAIHHVLAATPHELPVMVGNSMVARDVTSMQPVTKHPWVLAQRGVAGIDGNLSTAMGLSLGFQKPLVCIVGDLTMLHDMTALLSARICSQPVVVVVINNGGGKIFDTLPIAHKDADILNSYFTTPQSVNLATLAQAFDAVEYIGIQQRDELTSLSSTLNSALESTQGGVTLIDIQTDGTRFS
ncbi:MAG: 2-succinyl-5-enolpyruvyl-6-hydroxy-3-cyclohexene-1-carboxylic-acid synthase [Balneolaceae bacterium]|nr:2-succinyl-5-enolpyruvyl-6-hydroxy-3-cyclohexene-1-carboxylic-acid synthase [Balneolaceae bacterium]